MVATHCTPYFRLKIHFRGFKDFTSLLSIRCIQIRRTCMPWFESANMGAIAWTIRTVCQVTFYKQNSWDNCNPVLFLALCQETCVRSIIRTIVNASPIPAPIYQAVQAVCTTTKENVSRISIVAIPEPFAALRIRTTGAVYQTRSLSVLVSSLWK